MIDPPSGWMYGFPKKYSEEVDGDMIEWLLSQGYPKRLVEEYGDCFYVRSWTVQ